MSPAQVFFPVVTGQRCASVVLFGIFDLPQPADSFVAVDRGKQGSTPSSVAAAATAAAALSDRLGPATLKQE